MKKFFSKRAGRGTKLLSATPLMATPIYFLDGGIISIPFFVTYGILTAVTSSVGYGIDAKGAKNAEFTSKSGQNLVGAEWSKKYFQKLEKDLIKACAKEDNSKKQEILQELQALENFLDISDKGASEILYATKEGSILNFGVRNSLINAKGQYRFLNPEKYNWVKS